jgi:spore coat protein U-like protein
MRQLRVWIVVVLVFGVVPPARAACTVTTTPISLGVYDPFSAVPADSVGTVTFQCSGADRNITIMLGPGAAASFNPRTLVGAPDTLAYNLYQNAARTTVWGTGAGGTWFYSNANPPNNQNVVLTIFARIPPSQDVRAGLYADTVSVIVNF